MEYAILLKSTDPAPFIFANATFHFGTAFILLDETLAFWTFADIKSEFCPILVQFVIVVLTRNTIMLWSIAIPAGKLFANFTLFSFYYVLTIRCWTENQIRVLSYKCTLTKLDIFQVAVLFQNQLKIISRCNINTTFLGTNHTIMPHLLFNKWIVKFFKAISAKLVLTLTQLFKLS